MGMRPTTDMTEETASQAGSSVTRLVSCATGSRFHLHFDARQATSSMRSSRISSSKPRIRSAGPAKMADSFRIEAGSAGFAES